MTGVSQTQTAFKLRGSDESGVNYLRGSKIGSTTGYICVAGNILGLPHGRRSKSARGNSPRFDSVSEGAAKYRENPYCYASMDNKPLIPYSPNAQRSRLAIDDPPVPFKNASTIEFSDGIHTCHKKRFVTTHMVHYAGEATDPRSNPGIISHGVKFRNTQREK
eukprot:TRINITY_DN73970_c0_g1_i1.p1 TRINITY_DN73970_c0_g1~~TRINITY_DN73970_c0_g1_i1.p1  ORF type:complete len:163 (+),score=16.67 TRINITY_DN73970_c0_g1_i1:83-571(+)